jgi:hypothetical protein
VPVSVLLHLASLTKLRRDALPEKTIAKSRALDDAGLLELRGFES